MNSKILLVKNIHIDRQYTNVLSYSEAQMLELCQANLVAQADNYSFLRPTGSIMSGFTYAQCLQANYIAFQNSDYSNKWFFAWIDDVIYKGDKKTEITFTVDAWSTWFDKWTSKPCFIQREHTNDDTIGSNTIQEYLDVGDVVCEVTEEDISLSEYYWIAVETDWIPKDGSTGKEISDSDKGQQFSGITVYNKQVFGNQIILFQVNTIQDLENLRLYILRTNSDGHIADIQNIFVIPSALVDEPTITEHKAKVKEVEEKEFTFYTIEYTNEVAGFNISIDKITSFNDYIPKNKKCFCYPYNYLFVSNNIGNSNIFKYENFYGSDKATFRLDLVLSIGVSGKLTPINYKLMERDDDDSLPLAKYPTCAWSSDAFTNWLTQNAVNESTNMAFGIFGAANQYISSINANNQKVQDTGKSKTGSAIDLGVNIAGTVARQIGNFYSGALMPNIQGGNNTGNVTWATERNTFSFRCMRVKTENLKIIDDYFSRFGYATNRVKIPNITGRQNFNYIEIGSSEEIGYGEVPAKYMDTINNACRRGVTIWHNHANVGNYSLNNTIV